MGRTSINLRAWGYFLLALLTLSIALLLALASQVASQNSQAFTAAILAILSLLLAAAIALTIVPYLARRVRGEWFRRHFSYKITREGMVYFGATILLGLSAVNTGNNLLYIILSAMLASIIISGIASRLVLVGMELQIDFPERLFARQPALATLTISNKKRWLPSFSLTVEPNPKSERPIVFQKVYLPYLSSGASEKRRLHLVFDRRGQYDQSTVRISTRFPFGFITKSLEIPVVQSVIVFPALGGEEELFEILPLISGEIESYFRGRGMDLYALRDYTLTDSARAIHWKASARSETLKVKEFAREDERRLLIIFDTMTDDDRPVVAARFERAVSLCARLAQHFFDEGANLGYLLENGQLLEGRTEATLDLLFKELALLEMRRGPSPLTERVNALSPSEKDSFKIVFTLRAPGTLPTPLWESSHVVFIREKPLFFGQSTFPR